VFLLHISLLEMDQRTPGNASEMMNSRGNCPNIANERMRRSQDPPLPVLVCKIWECESAHDVHGFTWFWHSLIVLSSALSILDFTLHVNISAEHSNNSYVLWDILSVHQTPTALTTYVSMWLISFDS
jgi:hypothetical protein